MTQLMTHITNPISFGVTEFVNYPFTSMVNINGKLFGTSPDGLFLLDSGGLDVTANIDATWSTGQWDYGSPYIKRQSDMYIGMRSDGPIELEVTVDEKPSFFYAIDPLTVAEIKQRRTPVGKGLRGKYWNYTFRNTDGCYFDVDSIDAAAVLVSRRLG